MNLAACKSFYEQTGKDLTYVLMRYLEACRETVGQGPLERLKYFFGLEPAEDISKLFHCLIKQENKNIPLAEIQDAMFRVSWIPTDEDGDMCEPWPLVVVDLATQVNEYFSQLDKKKADI
jgi:hypothetical protein